MKVFSAYQNGRLTIYLTGELDHHEVKKSMSVIENLLDEYMPRECVLDLGSLSFMDSSGIALILKLHRRLSETGGGAWVENAASQPAKVLSAAGIGRIVKIGIAKEAQEAR